MGRATGRLSRRPRGLEASTQIRPPPRLTDQQWQGLLGVLAEGTMRSGFETERRTLPRVRAMIERRFGVTYHVDYLSARLRDLGWTAQLPGMRSVPAEHRLLPYRVISHRALKASLGQR